MALAIQQGPISSIEDAAEQIRQGIQNASTIFRTSPLDERIRTIIQLIAEIPPMQRPDLIRSLLGRANSLTDQEKFNIFLQILKTMDPTSIRQAMTNAGIDPRVAAPPRDANILALLSRTALRESTEHPSLAKLPPDERIQVITNVLDVIFAANPRLTDAINAGEAQGASAIRASCPEYQWIRPRTCFAWTVQALLIGGIFTSILNGKIPKSKGLIATALTALIYPISYDPARTALLIRNISNAAKSSFVSLSAALINHIILMVNKYFVHVQ